MRYFSGTILPLLLIVTMGVVFRTWGLAHDLPAVYEQDESRVMEKALEVADGRARHGVILFGSLPVYTVALAIRAVGTFVPQIKGGYETFVESSLHDRTAYYLIGRSVSALYGTMELAILSWLGVLLFGWKAAIVASLFLSISTLAIEFAHAATPDTALSATMLLSVLVATLAYKRQSAGLFVLSGIVSGLSGGQKFPGLLAVGYTLVLLLSHPNARVFAWKKKISLALLVIVACVIGYVASYPYIFTDYDLLLKQWQWMSGAQRYWDRPPYYDSGVVERIRQAFGWLPGGIGTLIYALSITGWILSLRSSSPVPRLLLGFAFSFLLVNALPVKQGNHRYLPLMPYLSLWAGIAFTTITTVAFTRLIRYERLQTVGFALTLFLVILAPFLKSIFFIHMLVSPDTRTLAAQWVRDHGIDAHDIARDPATGDDMLSTSDPAHPLYAHQADRWIHKQTVRTIRSFPYALVSDEFANWYYGWERYYPELKTTVDVFRFIEAQGTPIAKFAPRGTEIDRDDVAFLRNFRSWTLDQVRGPRIVLYNLADSTPVSDEYETK